MKISVDIARRIIRFQCWAVILDDDNQNLIKTKTEVVHDRNPDVDYLLLNLDYINDEGLEFTLCFREKINQEVEWEDRIGRMTLIDEGGDAVSFYLLEPTKHHFDTTLFDDLPLDRGIYNDKIERFKPYDRLGYEYQQWLHKNREALVKENGRFAIEDKVKVKQ